MSSRFLPQALPGEPGSTMVKRLPSPTLLSTSILPPCASTMCRTTVNPSPAPPASPSFAARER